MVFSLANNTRAFLTTVCYFCLLRNVYHIGILYVDITKYIVHNFELVITKLTKYSRPYFSIIKK